MPNIYNAQPETRIVGNDYASEASAGFKDEVRGIFESYAANGINLGSTDMYNIVASPLDRAEFEDKLMESFSSDGVLTGSACAREPFYNNYTDRCRQLMDNSMTAVAQESVMQGYRPIVAYNPFFLKKQWVDCVWKDIIMTEVPESPVINYAFERRYIQTADGTRYEIPDVFYDDVTMAKLNSQATGIAMLETKETALPMKNTDILTADFFPGVVVTDRPEMLTQDLHVIAVHFKETSSGKGDDKWVNCNLSVDATDHNWMPQQLGNGLADTAAKTDMLVGRVDFEAGTVTIMSTTDNVDMVKMSGKLANKWNERGLDVKRKAEHLQYTMPESGPRMNTAITIEEAADALALGKIDLVSDNVDMMGRTLGEFEDHSIRTFVTKSYDVQRSAASGVFGYKEGMTVAANFDTLPYEGYNGNITQWMKDIREYFERAVNQLKNILKTKDCVIVAVGNPLTVRYLQEGINWVFSDETTVSGVKLNYNFGIYTTAQDRVHIISSQYIPEATGLMMLVIPTTKELITFKHFKYNMTIDRGYRNPVHTLVPNVMATHRTLDIEVLPVQGRLVVDGRSFNSPKTLHRTTG